MNSGFLLSLAVVVGSAVTIVPTNSVAQSDSLAIELPNPDGRDPTFDSSRRGRQIEIEFSRPGDDGVHGLADFPARLRLINFWASWCVPCLRELPSLTELGARYPDQAVKVLAISMDRADLAEVAEFVDALGLPGLDWYIDQSREAGQAAGVMVLPTSIVVDSAGRELGRVVGSADWASDEAMGLMERLLGEGLPD